MAIVQRTPPTLSLPSAGATIAVSDEEWSTRQSLLTKELASIDAEDDTPDDVYSKFIRNVDEERRRAGRPPAFAESS